ncbi:HNH endonuclease domain-containing protein [Rothia nasimurium]|uniref:HNH endonuclease domain-containing protein n=1 Tax=Rothia nasimurium TaxID=85336 RepID=UPI001F1C01D6|nr:HNH endonuclease domain-containing protein [Rothia nasimurium]
MLSVNKNVPPRDFQIYSRNSSSYIYDQTTGVIKGKDTWERFRGNRSIFRALQNSLKEESFYLCTYCEKSIDGNNTGESQVFQIEHIFPKSLYPSLCLSYTNLVACCFGDDGISESRCGQKKGDYIPRITPFSNKVREKIEIKSNGLLVSSNSAMQDFIYNLNLNTQFLVDARKDAISAKSGAFESLLKYIASTDNVQVEQRLINKFLDSIDQLNGVKKDEYSGFVRLYYENLILNSNLIS